MRHPLKFIVTFKSLIQWYFHAACPAFGAFFALQIRQRKAKNIQPSENREAEKMRVRSYFTAGLYAAALVSASSFAADANPTDLMAAAIDLGHRYDSNYAAKNPDAMAALYASDGVLVSPSGPIVRGRTALHDYYVKRFASGAQSHAITVKEVHVKGNGGYAIADFSVTVPGKNGKLHKENGSLVAIYQHDSDGWHLSLVEPSVPAR